MKKMSQKMWAHLAIFAFILLTTCSLSAQNIVIMDDVSSIIVPNKDAKPLPAKIVVESSKVTFKGNYVLSGATTVTIAIIDPSTQAKMVKTTANIQNTTYLIQNLDISMLALNKWYNIIASFNGTTSTSQNGQIKRIDATTNSNH